jgi:Lon-like protease
VEALEPIVPPAVDRPSRRRAWWYLGGFVVLLVAGVVAAAFVQVPYFLLSPGSVRSTEPLIDIEGAPSYPADPGEVGFTTVSLRHATALQALIGWLDPTVDVVDEDLILGGQTEEENRRANLADMTSSKDRATAVALVELGYEVPVEGTGAIVFTVSADVPAATVLEPGDVIIGADGRSIAVADELVAIVQAKRPGDPLELRLERPGIADPIMTVTAIASRPEAPTEPMLGVQLGTRDLRFDFPFEVTIDSGDVGGPSAGLAFTLGIMDALTPDSITGGLRVATTGTIDLEGNVGPVGGVQQKTVAVRRSGVDLFLVPSSEYELAKELAGEMRVEPVDTIDDALAVLSSLGGGATVVQAQGAPAGS